MNEQKVERERNILRKALPLLRKLYGDFEIDECQKDRPDAAIILGNKSKPKKIGIEITSVDKQADLQYFNDEKMVQELTINQINNLELGRSYDNKPKKKASIEFSNSYIYEGVIKKKDKYIDYIQSANYKEIILLAFSDYLSLKDEDLKDYQKKWTNFLLSKDNYPFDKVIFVCIETEQSILLYNKKVPFNKEPARRLSIERGITVMRTSVLPFGETVNLFEMFEQEPSAQKTNKKNKKNET